MLLLYLLAILKLKKTLGISHRLENKLLRNSNSKLNKLIAMLIKTKEISLMISLLCDKKNDLELINIVFLRAVKKERDI